MDGMCCGRVKLFSGDLLCMRIFMWSMGLAQYSVDLLCDVLLVVVST